MEALLEKYGWKKIAFALIAIALLSLVFVILSLSGVDRRATEAIKERQIEQEKELGNSQSEEFPSSQTYPTPFYTVNYPSHYEVIPLIPSGGALHLLKLQDVSSNAVIEILVTSAVTPVTALAQSYEGLGFDKREFNHQLGSAVEYSGTLGDTNIHQRIGFITTDDTIIRFLASYESEGFDQSLEQDLSDIFTGIR